MLFEELIKQNIALMPPNNKGWCKVLCAVCNDHGGKGLRAGFRFDVDSIHYKCFNCSHKACYLDSNKFLSDEFKIVLTAFGIHQSSYTQHFVDAMGHKNTKQSTAAPTINHNPSVITLPVHFKPLHTLTSNERAPYDRYLMDRLVDPNSYTFYISEHSKLVDRIIIPYYNAMGQLVYYQGRDITGKSAKRYENSSDGEMSKVIFNESKLALASNLTVPLYVFEGFFDAMMFDGISPLSKDVSISQITRMKRSKRRLIFVPDRSGEGTLAKHAIDNGWEVALPNIGNCDDINEAVKKYGKLFVARTIAQNTYSPEEAGLMLPLYLTRK